MSDPESLPLLSSRESDGSFFLSLERAIGYIIVGGEPGWAESTRFILLSTRFNAFLVCVPLAIISKKLEWDADLRFAFSLLGIIPLANLIDEATGPISMRLNYTLGCLLSSSLGNAVEIIVGLAALLHGELRILQTFILGSILSNSVLVLGMSFLAGGVCFHEMYFFLTAAQTGASLMTLASIVLVIPTAYMSSLKHPSTPPIPGGTSAPTKTEVIDGSRYDGLLPLSHSAALILLALYIVYLFFQLRTHSDLFRPHYDDESVAEVEPSMSAISSAAWLFGISTATYLTADVLVGSIEKTANKYHVALGFIGLILLPLVANTAKHCTAARMAMHGHLDLIVGTSMGNSVQIVTCALPLLQIVSWIIGKGLTLAFAEFETVALFVSVIFFNLLVVNGKSNYMDGIMCCALYVVIAMASWEFWDY